MLKHTKEISVFYKELCISNKIAAVSCTIFLGQRKRDWTQTQVLWYRNRPSCRLCHNHYTQKDWSYFLHKRFESFYAKLFFHYRLIQLCSVWYRLHMFSYPLLTISAIKQTRVFRCKYIYFCVRKQPTFWGLLQIGITSRDHNFRNGFSITDPER